MEKRFGCCFMVCRLYSDWWISLNPFEFLCFSLQSMCVEKRVEVKLMPCLYFIVQIWEWFWDYAGTACLFESGLPFSLTVADSGDKNSWYSSDSDSDSGEGVACNAPCPLFLSSQIASHTFFKIYCAALQLTAEVIFFFWKHNTGINLKRGRLWGRRATLPWLLNMV